MTTRRISVFTRPDGKSLHDRPWDPDAAPSTAQPNPSADTLWPLIQVFLQFSRDVQGGTVRRLVFRSPTEYTPEPQTFQPARVPPPQPDPLVAHIAHDDLFAVVVTEICTQRRPVPDDHDAAEGIAELCATVLDFLKSQQTAFLATLDQLDVVNRAERRIHKDESNASSLATDESSVHKSRPLEVETPPGNSQKPVVVINHAKLSDFIAKTQTTLQL